MTRDRAKNGAAVEPAAAQPHRQGQLSTCAISPCSRTAARLGAALPLPALNDAEELSPSPSGLSKSTASPHALLPPQHKHRPSPLQIAPRGGSRAPGRWSAHSQPCRAAGFEGAGKKLPARKHCRIRAAVGKPQLVLRQVSLLESSREAAEELPEPRSCWELQAPSHSRGRCWTCTFVSAMSQTLRRPSQRDLGIR